MWNSVFLLIYLSILSIFDLKKKMVPVALLALGLMIWGSEAIYRTIEGNGTWQQIPLGILPGLVFLIIARITGKIGYADGAVLLVIGLAEDYLTSLFVLCMSLFGAAIISLLLVFLHRVNRNTRLPYIPFLTVAFLLKEVIT